MNGNKLILVTIRQMRQILKNLIKEKGKESFEAKVLATDLIAVYLALDIDKLLISLHKLDTMARAAKARPYCK